MSLSEAISIQLPIELRSKGEKGRPKSRGSAATTKDSDARKHGRPASRSSQKTTMASLGMG